MKASGPQANATALAKQVLAEASCRSLADVPDDAAIGTWDGWDSLTHMRLILTMETRLGHELPAEAVVRIENLEQVAAHFRLA